MCSIVAAVSTDIDGNGLCVRPWVGHSAAGASTWSAQLPSESVLAIPDRPASKPEPLHCIWLHRSVRFLRAAAAAPHDTARNTRQRRRFSGRTDWRVLCVRPWVGHSAAGAGSMQTQAIPVVVGAPSGGDRAHGRLSCRPSPCWRYPTGLHQIQSHCIASGSPVRSRAAAASPA